MKHPLEWFLARQNTPLQRNGRKIVIKTEREAQYHFELQDKGFSYTQAED